jgi:hypothetical protein
VSAITSEVRAALAAAVVDGSHLRLVGELDRKAYAAVDKALQALGGKWDRKVRAHVFPSNPTDALAAVLATGEAGKVPKTPKQVEAYFATPDTLADEVVRGDAGLVDAPAGFRVLEPSAGDGALIRAIRRASPAADIVAIEPNRERADRCLIGAGHIAILHSTLEESVQHGVDGLAPFDAVVMNPPFALPGAATAWIDHVDLAWSLVRPGGRLASIVPNGFTYRQDRKHCRIRSQVEALGGWRSLSDGSFASSGTDIHTAVIWMDKPSGGAA